MESRTAYLDCFTYEPEQECCGASGRKMRRVCIRCPNHERWRCRKMKEKEGKEHEENH